MEALFPYPLGVPARAHLYALDEASEGTPEVVGAYANAATPEFATLVAASTPEDREPR